MRSGEVAESESLQAPPPATESVPGTEGAGAEAPADAGEGDPLRGKCIKSYVLFLYTR